MQLLSECSGTEEEGGVTAVCNLADDIRDAIAEYQVSDSVVHAVCLAHDEVNSLHNRTQYLNRTPN